MAELVPRLLLGLPSPWDRLNLDTESVANSASARATAVAVLDRALDGLAELPPGSRDDLPEEMTIAWGLHNFNLRIHHMPRFDDIRLETIRNSFKNLEPAPSASEVWLYGIEFVRQQADRLRSRVKDWLFKALRSDPDEEVFEALCRLVERQWRVHPEFARSQIFYLSVLDRDKALELAQHILGSPDIQPELAASLKGRIERLNARSTS